MKFTISADELKSKPEGFIFADEGMDIPAQDIPKDYSKILLESKTPKSASRQSVMGIATPRQRSEATMIGAGLGGGFEGALLGVKQAGAEMGNRLGMVDDSTVANLREQELDRRATMNALSQEPGGNARFNQARFAEGVGLTAPYLAMGGGGGIAGGAMLGGATGYMQPRAPGESRGKEALKGAALGAAIPAAVKGAGAALGYGVNKLAQVVEGKTGPLTGRIDSYLRTIAPYSTAMVKDPKKLAQLKQTRADGVVAINKYKDELKFADETGELVAQNRAPQNQFEFLTSIEQVKNNLFKKYDAIREKASGAGIQVAPTRATSELERISRDMGYTPEQRAYAKKLMSDFEADGIFSPESAQSRIANYNEELANFYSGKQVKDIGDPAVKKRMLDAFRQDLIKSIEQAGPEYAEFRKEWGAVNALEEDTLRAYENMIKKTKKIDPMDILAVEQLLYAAAKGNPSYLIPAAGSKIIGSMKKWLNSPDRAVKAMFKEVEKARIPKVEPFNQQKMLPPPERGFTTGNIQTVAPVTHLGEAKPINPPPLQLGSPLEQQLLGGPNPTAPRLPQEPSITKGFTLGKGKPVQQTTRFSERRSPGAPKQIEHLQDVRESFDYAFKKWQAAEAAGDKGAAAWWRGKAEEAVAYAKKLRGGQ